MHNNVSVSTWRQSILFGRSNNICSTLHHIVWNSWLCFGMLDYLTYYICHLIHPLLIYASILYHSCIHLCIYASIIILFVYSFIHTSILFIHEFILNLWIFSQLSYKYLKPNKVVVAAAAYYLVSHVSLLSLLMFHRLVNVVPETNDFKIENGIGDLDLNWYT